ncbi:MAG: pre-peptidase C-terminal domain-containing protein [Gemmataceae bacterium]
MPSWGGVPPSVISPPANPVAVALDGLNDAQGDAAVTANEVDYYSFIAPVSGIYQLSALTPSSSLDTVLGVFTSAGSRIAFNDDISSFNRDSRLTVSLTAGQRYYFGITNYIGTAGGSYTWVVDGPSGGSADDGFEENDTLAQASNLGTLTAARTVSGLVLADGADWFRFTTSLAGTAASSVAISFQNAQGNLALQLYNASGEILRGSDGTGNGETITLNGLAAGTYYARVYGSQGATNPSYSLTVTPPTSSTSGGFDIQVAIGGGLTASQQAAFEQAAARWEQIITGDLPNATYAGQVVDDLLIQASGVAIDGVNGILGQAGPDAFRSGTLLPYHGVMQFDTADLASLEQRGQLVSVIMHEMGHVLGIGTIWQQRGLLAGAGTSNSRFTGAAATAQYNAIFGTTATAVPVENTGGSGTRDSHWRESVFGAELMTGFLNSGVTNPLSRVTVASLADLGYQVNLAAADPYTPPGAGLRAGSGSSGGGSAASLLAGGGSPSLVLGQAVIEDSSEEGTACQPGGATGDTAETPSGLLSDPPPAARPMPWITSALAGRRAPDRLALDEPVRAGGQDLGLPAWTV